MHVKSDRAWKGILDKKNVEFDTACCCLLVACHCSLKRDFPDSGVEEYKWHFLNASFLDCVASATSGSFRQEVWLQNIWMGFVNSVLLLAWWQYEPALCLELGWCAWLRGTNSSSMLDCEEWEGSTVYAIVITQLKFYMGRQAGTSLYSLMMIHLKF